jgi:DNA-binding transcriptional LysR family regulator
MLDQITHLFRLQAIVEEGSLRRAAERLNLTQPALSRSLAQLEAHFGRPLLERHARGVRPTLFGERVLSESLRMMRHWEVAEQELMSDRAIGKAYLRIGAGPMWRPAILPELLVDMQRRFPKIVFELRNSRYATSITDLLEGRLDMLFTGMTVDDPQDFRLVALPLTNVINNVMAREDHPIFAARDAAGAVPPERLLDYPWLVHSELPIYQATTQHGLFERLGREPDIRLSCESLHSTLSILQRSDCLCLLPDAAVLATSCPRIVPVPVNLSYRHTRTGVIYREELSDWAPVRQLIALCRERFHLDNPPEVERGDQQ